MVTAFESSGGRRRIATALAVMATVAIATVVVTAGRRVSEPMASEHGVPATGGESRPPDAPLTEGDARQAVFNANASTSGAPEGSTGHGVETESEVTEPRAYLDVQAELVAATFLTDAPDLAGLTRLIGRFAEQLTLDPVAADLDEYAGEATVPGAGLAFGYKVGPGMIKLTSRPVVDVPGVGKVQFAFNVELETADDRATMAHLVVHAMPSPEQTFYDEMPVGHMFRISEQESITKEIRGGMNDGVYGIHMDVDFHVAPGENDGLEWAQPVVRHLRRLRVASDAQQGR